MSVAIYPKLEELYTAVIKDCYKCFSQRNNENYNYSKEDSEKEKIDIVSMAEILKSFILNYKPMNKELSYLISFSSKYINNIYEYYKNIEKNNIELKDYSDFCLAYIALVGFRTCCINKIDDNELFKFVIQNYENFKKFFDEYRLLSQIKPFYEENSSRLKYNIYYNKYLYIVVLFHGYDILFPEENKGVKNNGKKNNENLNAEPLNEVDLNSTKENSGKKEQNDNSKENNNIIEFRGGLSIENNLIENSETNEIKEKDEANLNSQRRKNINETRIKKNESKDNDINIQILNERMLKMEMENQSMNQKIITLNQNIQTLTEKNQSLNQNIITLTKENQSMNQNIQTLTEKNQSMDQNIQTVKIEYTFNNINLQFKQIEANESLKYEKIFNSAYLNIGKKKIECLEAYNRSLKNICINLSNPYNFNFWRKIANIILKNIFIILKNERFTITQNKDKSILKDLKYIAENMKFNQDNINQLNQKFKDYKNEISGKKRIKTGNIAPTGNKDRKFNLITIYKNSEPDIIASLSIDFLFHLKEKGNQINHFDEALLNLILFNDIIIVDEDEIGIEDNEEDEIKNDKLNNTNSKVQEDEKRNLNLPTNKIKNEEVKFDGKNKIKENEELEVNAKEKKEEEIIDNKNEEVKNNKKEKEEGTKILEENKELKVNKIEQKQIKTVETENEKLKNFHKKGEKTIITEIEEIENNNKGKESENEGFKYNEIDKKEEKIIKKEEGKINKAKGKETKIIENENKEGKITVQNKGDNINETKSEEIKDDKKKIEDKKDNADQKVELKMNENQIKGINKNNDEQESEKENAIKPKENILNIEYKGKKLFSGDELVKMLENPFKFQQKNIAKRNLFDYIYKQVDDLKKEIGYNDDKKAIFNLEKESKNLNSEIKKLKENIASFLEIYYNNKIDIKNIQEINSNENIEADLKKIVNMYSELIQLETLISEKIKYYGANKEKFDTLKNSIVKNEEETNKYIDKIEQCIGKAAMSIKLEDIFCDYKKSLKINIDNEIEYKQYSDIFNKNSIDNFDINNFYQFLGKYLKGEFSIAKRDITNYNAYVEVLTSFNELKKWFQKNVDLKID